MLQRILGLISLVTGIWLIVGFPFFDKYIPEGMERFGILLGIFLVGIGVFLLRF